MAKYTGAVRFPDKSLLYFLFKGTVDVADIRLYTTPEEVDAIRRGDIQQVPEPEITQDLILKSEQVEVMPYYLHGSDEVHFLTTASRSVMVITGPRSLESAQFENDRNNSSPWGYMPEGESE